MLLQLCFSQRGRLLPLILCLLPLLLSGGRLDARAGYQEAHDDVDSVDIYLHTVDVGNLIFNNFGHTALRVHDRKSGSDLVFNWGIFDFGDPLSFSLRFYRGILVYKLGIFPYSSTLRFYLAEQRTAWEDKLNLTREEKAVLLDRLAWNSQPENRPYNYQYFYDNCSTRPRDYLNEAIGGKLKAQTELLTQQTYRGMMYDGYAFNPGMDVLLDVGMNDRLDHRLSAWDRMFHPIALRETLLQVQTEHGPLISETHLLSQFPGPNSYRDLAYLSILLGCGIPLCLLGTAFYLFGARSALLWRLFALVALPLTGFGALVGFLMPLSWALSAHLDLHHNANQLVFWPFDAVYVLMLLAMLVKGRVLRLGPKAWRIFTSYSATHLLVSLLLPILRALDVVKQDVDRPLVYLLPPYLAIIFLILRVGVQKEAALWKKPQERGKSDSR